MSHIFCLGSERPGRFLCKLPLNFPLVRVSPNILHTPTQHHYSYNTPSLSHSHTIPLNNIQTITRATKLLLSHSLHSHTLKLSQSTPSSTLPLPCPLPLSHSLNLHFSTPHILTISFPQNYKKKLFSV